MVRIETAFYRAYSKRSWNSLMVLIPVFLMVAAQIAMFVENKSVLIIAACVFTVGFVICHRVLVSRKAYVRQKIEDAIRPNNSAAVFWASIEAEMQDSSLLSYIEERNRICIFVTLNWLILTSPNGCLVCMVNDIKEVFVDLRKQSRKRRGRFRLEVVFENGKSFVCAYQHLYEPLIGLIEERRSK